MSQNRVYGIWYNITTTCNVTQTNIYYDTINHGILEAYRCWTNPSYLHTSTPKESAGKSQLTQILEYNTILCNPIGVVWPVPNKNIPTNLIYWSNIMTLEWWKEVTLYYDSAMDQWICENRELEKKIQLSMKELRQPLRNSFLLPNPSILTKDQIWVIPVIPEPPVGWFEGNVCNPWFFPSTRIHKDRANVLLISPLGALNTSPIKVDWDHRPFDRFPVQFRRRSAPQERPCPSWRHLLSAHPPGGDGAVTTMIWGQHFGSRDLTEASYLSRMTWLS